MHADVLGPKPMPNVLAELEPTQSGLADHSADIPGDSLVQEIPSKQSSLDWALAHLEH